MSKHNHRLAFLIVEDEPAVSALISTTLNMAGYEAMIAQNASQAQDMLNTAHRVGDVYSGMIIDWMLPQMNGIALIQLLRQQNQYRSLPILMLTAKALENDKIEGLESGADDYLTKPFSPRELVARVNALVRRSQPLRDETQLFVGCIALNPSQATVRYYTAYHNTDNNNEYINLNINNNTNNKNNNNNININEHIDDIGTYKFITLSYTEFKLLQCLMLQPKRVYTREQLLTQVWEKTHEIDNRTVDAHIKRLRQALLAVGCDDYVHTVRGMGYTLSKHI